MNTSIPQATTAPCFLATNRGFYRGPASTEAAVDTLMFTANIRQATPFSSFDEATACFKKLRDNDYQQLCIASYYAVVSGVQGASKLLPAEAVEQEDAVEEVKDAAYYLLHPRAALVQDHPDSCICATCLNY